MRDPEIYFAQPARGELKLAACSEVLLQDADYLIKRNRRCWFQTRVKKSRRARLPGST
jgi:hypothetical protein